MEDLLSKVLPKDSTLSNFGLFSEESNSVPIQCSSVLRIAQIYIPP